MEIVCKPSTPEDAQFLQDLFFDARAPEFLLAGLSGPMLTQLLEMQYRAQQAGYAAGHPAAVNEIVWVDGQRAGRILVDHAGDALELVDIALLQSVRGRGVGARVLQQLCDTADQGGKVIKLSVRPGNPAQRLYERLGFTVTALEPTQIWMERSVNGTRSTADAVAVALPQSVTRREIQDPATQDYTFAYFRSLVGATLQARPIRDDAGTGPEAVPLRVASVAQLSHPGGAVELGDSFRMELTGSNEAAFGGECIEILPPGGDPMAVFVSPLGPSQGRMVYEVVFNRMRQL